MISQGESTLGIGRIESVDVLGDRLAIGIRLQTAGQPVPPDLANPKGISANVDDVAKTALKVRSVAVDGEVLRVILSGLPHGSRIVFIRIEGLIPGRDTATVRVGGDAPPFDPAGEPPRERSSAPSTMVSYLAKDFLSFRRLMLDTISQDVHGLTERHEADGYIAMVEVLAYAADHLSYYQDAVATEAYLQTARRRVSVRRHARLIGYAFHEGCTARAWIQVLPKAPFTLLKGFKAATRSDVRTDRRIYETLITTTLWPSLSEMRLWDYADPRYVLPQGATSAVIVRRLAGGAAPLPQKTVLVFEQRRLPDGQPAERSNRHAVRLTSDAQDFPYPGDPDLILSRIEWSQEDALPFELPARTRTGARQAASVVLGNIVPADFGETISPAITGLRLDHQWTLRIAAPDLTYAVPYDDEEPASAFMEMRPYRAMPEISVHVRTLGSQMSTWRPCTDLIGANPYDRVFAVEPESGGSVLLRFGDGVNGMRPDPASTFDVHWRQGNGVKGRVGADALIQFDFTRDQDVHEPIERVRNPLPSGGAQDPLPIATAKREAPALVRRQRRCITDADYAEIAQSIPGVTAAIARRWTGSGETVDVYVYAGADGTRKRALVKKALERSTPIGVRVTVREPRRVGVVVKLGVVTAPDANANDVLARAVAAAAAEYDANNVTMGKPLFASWFVSAISRVRGVSQVTVMEFRRLEDPQPAKADVIRFAPTELPLLVDEFGMITAGRPLVEVIS